MENKNPVIRIKDLHMSYSSGPEILKGIDLEVYPGQVIGYIGPNGAGKSTTVKIMLGILDQYKGDVEVMGQNIRGQVDYKMKIGYVPESGDVYDSLTAYEYLRFLGTLYQINEQKLDDKINALMEMFQLKDQIDNRISSLSKGMKQKLLIIASLIHDPDILFLDEPLSGLDANSVLIIKEILARLASEGKTIFYSSHIMDVVEKISDRIILLNNGVIAADGTFDELKQSNLDESLEEIFNDITGYNDQASIADKVVSTMKEA